MAGTFRGFKTRAQLGLRAPRNVSRRISPGQGGVTVHYGGPKVGITASTRHSACERRWKAWQDFHMGRERGWSDVAYTGAFCQHGYAFAGRGAGVRTAGQGTNRGNDISYAIVFIGGEGDVPTDDALAAMDWWISTLRKAGAGNRVWGHWEWKPTSCPGRPLFNAAKARDRKSVTAGKAAAAPTSTGPISYPIAADGDLGPTTRGAWEEYLGLKVDKSWDRMDVRALQTWAGSTRTGQLSRMDVRRMETKLGLPRTGRMDKTLVLAMQNFVNRRMAEKKG